MTGAPRARASDGSVPSSASLDAAEGRRSIELALLSVVVLGIIGVLLPLLIARHYDALRIPRSDDWAYLRVLFQWDRTGDWRFNNWVAMTLVGQVVLAEPVVKLFGESITAVRVLTAVLGLFGLLAVVALGRSMRLARGAALLVAVSIAAQPMWGPLAATYMTDIPSFAFQIAAIAAGVRALRGRRVSLGWLIVALSLADVAFTIRQYGVIPLLVISAAALVRSRRGERHDFVRTCLCCAVAFAAVFVFYIWWASLPEKLLVPSPPSPSRLRFAIADAAGFLRICGLVVAPVVIARGPVRVVRRAWESSRGITRGAALGAGGLLVLGYLLVPARPFVGNYLDRLGTLSDNIISGPRVPIMPAALFDAVAIVASAAAVVLVLAAVPWCAQLVEHRREVHPVRALIERDPAVLCCAAALVGYGFALEAARLVGLPMYDRYVLPALPLAGVLCFRATGGLRVATHSRAAMTRRWARAVAAIAVLLGLGVVYSAESASYDATRWHLAEQVHALGYPQRAIYSGYEWPGFFFGRAPHGRNESRAQAEAIRRDYLEGVCVQIVGGGARRPADAIASATYAGLLHKPAYVYAIKEHQPCAVAVAPDFVP